MAEPLRLVFMGSDPVALPLLDWLAGEGGAFARLESVFTGPDRPSGRGQSVRPNAVKAWTEGRALDVRQPERLGDAELDTLRGLAPDAVLVVAYGHILRDAFISAPRLGTLNLHASLLPRHRGASPIQTAVASGDTEAGMALMRIVRELDAGPVAGVERVPIGPLDTAEDVEARLARAAIPLLARSLPLLARGELAFSEQDAAGATYCRRLVKEDGALDFAAPARVLSARVNGLHPWPSAAVEIAGCPVRLGLADALDADAGAAPGTVVGSDGEGLLVAATPGILRIRRMQRPGGRMLAALEFLRGHPVAPGTRIESRPMAPLSAASPFRR
jgi:methionyl-tRNA formyltransferase